MTKYTGGGLFKSRCYLSYAKMRPILFGNIVQKQVFATAKE